MWTCYCTFVRCLHHFTNLNNPLGNETTISMLPIRKICWEIGCEKNITHNSQTLKEKNPLSVGITATDI